MSEDTSSDKRAGIDEALLARVLVERGLATEEEVNDCRTLLKAQRDEGDSKVTLVRVLLDNGAITESQLQRLKPTLQKGSSQQIPGYQILERIGSGANAVVYKARQLSLDRTVAIKVLSKKLSSDPKYVERFFAEGRAAARLNHPNIVGALDVSKSGEFNYFVMEFVDGRTVFDELEDIVRYDEEDAVRIVLSMARALKHAHEAGFVHRDVKPMNIIITPEGVPKLLDMGLARAVEEEDPDANQKGKAIGSPYYMSPEQVLNRDIDFRSDIYSLGATFYHMVTGQPPLDADTAQGVMKRHLVDRPPLPEQLNPAVSANVSQIIQCCMRKRRAKRYDTTEQLVQDLEAVLNGEQPLQAQLKQNPAAILDDDDDRAVAIDDVPSEVVPSASVQDAADNARASGGSLDVSPAGDRKRSLDVKLIGLIVGWVVAIVMAAMYVMK